MTAAVLQPVLAAPPRDRGGFLIFLGIVEIVTGALVACCGLLTLLVLLKTGGIAGGLAPSQRMAVRINLMSYLGSALFMIVMGIGTMRVRRWARVLMLIASWSFLVAAIFGLAIMGALLPGILGGMDGGTADPAYLPAIAVGVMLIVGGVMIGLPLFFIVAYNGRHVRHAFATRHPEPVWVDGRPTSVLALSLVMALLGLLQIAASWSRLGVLFGVPLQGPAAVVVNLLLGAAWMTLAFGILKLNRAAWLASFGFTTLIHITAFFAYRSTSLIEVVHRLGMSAAEAATIGNMAPFFERWSGAGAVVSGLVWIVSLLAVRRHFRSGANPVVAA